MLSTAEQLPARLLLSAADEWARDTKHMELKDIIRQERMRRGWSQRVLAKALGVSGGAVAQWELGDSGVSFARLIDICNVFGLEISAFLGEGSPYAGQIVEGPEELSLLAAWREVPEEDRATLLRVVRNAGRRGPRDIKAPKKLRKEG